MIHLKEPAIEWFSFFDISPDLVCIAGKDGYFKKVNPAVIQKLGYTEAELFAIPISSFIHPEDKEKTGARRSKLLKGTPLVDFENRYVAKDGTYIWLHWTSIYLADKEIVFAIARDVSARKHMEKEIAEKYRKAQGMASHFKISNEKDRKYFAYEIQEQLAQMAAMIKLDVGALAEMPGLPEAHKERVDHALAASELLLKTIQRVSFSISPKILDDFGLNATLEWLCREFSILNNIKCRFQGRYDEATLTPEIKTDLYRICQEALINVMNHAGATSVWIGIEESAGKLQLTITDDGKGFDIHQPPGHGLISISERVKLLNGMLEINSDPGAGTRICVTVNSQ